MTDHVYKIIEVTGSSPQSSDAAIANAISHTAKSVNHLDWFEVIETRGQIQAGGIAHYQVVLKIGFRVDK